jgi:tetratricopeptide (TPR) repeat protein
MRKLFLIIVLTIFSEAVVFAQTESEKNAYKKAVEKDSLEIVRLQRMLQSLNDTARINCLNNLAQKFMTRAGYMPRTRTDSAFSYATSAYKEATQIDYKYGLAQSILKLINVCGINHYNNINSKIDNTTNFNTWESLLNKLFILTPQVNDAEIWGQAYSWQAQFMNLNLTLQKKKRERIEAYQNAILWYTKSGNQKKIVNILYAIGVTLSENTEYEKAFDYYKQSLQLAKKLFHDAGHDDENDMWVQIGLMAMADMYKIAGDYESALDFLRESRQFHFQNIKYNTLGGMEQGLGAIFLELKQYDSAYYYIEPIASGKYNPWKATNWPLLAEIYMMTGKYDSAAYYYNNAIDSIKKMPLSKLTSDPLWCCYYGKAKLLALKKDYKSALKLATEGVSYAQLSGKSLAVLKNHELQSQIFHQLGKNDSAYHYLRKYMSMKDSMVSRQLLWRLNNYKSEIEEAKKEGRIGFLDRDNKIKEQQLKQEAQLKNFLLLGLLGLLTLGVFAIRWITIKRKAEKFRLQKDLEMQQMESAKKQAELHQRAVELEMQALRAQMNPHFIFNCLSSINRFIFKNDNKTASDYLTRFSRLIRMVLMHSSKKLITLEDELEMLRLYLDLERLRFKDAFDYSITTTNIVDAGVIFIPPLLLQPFCENAVWHGLMHKESKGHLKIIISEVISEHEKVLHCVIEDDGVGRKKAAEMKSKSAESEKSLGLKITTERLALLNQENNFSTFYKIEDILNENNGVTGTRVQLKIRHKESIEEYA